MRVATRDDTDIRVRMRPERFDSWCVLLNLRTDVDRAKFFGYTERTIRRARAGQIGVDFIALTIHGFRTRADDLAPAGPPSFDDLFLIEVA